MKISQISFAELDKQKGIPAPAQTDVQEYPLPAWYRSIKDVPLNELGVEDICKACRQCIHLEYVIPIALGLLHENLLAGEMYDGELLFSLTSVPTDYWNKHPDQKQKVQGLLRETAQLPASVIDYTQELLVRLAQ